MSQAVRQCTINCIFEPRLECPSTTPPKRLARTMELRHCTTTPVTGPVHLLAVSSAHAPGWNTGTAVLAHPGEFEL